MQKVIFELMYVAIGTNTDSLPRQSGFRFGLENAPIKKSFAASKMCSGGKKIIGRLHHMNQHEIR